MKFYNFHGYMFYSYTSAWIKTKFRIPAIRVINLFWIFYVYKVIANVIFLIVAGSLYLILKLKTHVRPPVKFQKSPNTSVIIR